MVTIKSQREIELMREAGKILAKVHEELGRIVKPGISTKEIDRICEEMIRSHGCIPSFLNYEGYPASVCISINDEVVHGIPSKHRYLNEGDIVSLDTGVIWKGYQSDAARTHMIGEVTPQARKLVEVTQQSFFEGIKFAKEGNHLAEVALDAFVYRVAKYVGAYTAAMNGVDAIAFTAGVGENDKATRKKVCEYLGYLGVKIDDAANDVRGKRTVISAPDSKVKVMLIPTNEELAIARETLRLVK